MRHLIGRHGSRDPRYRAVIGCRALKHAAEVILDSPAALQVRGYCVNISILSIYYLYYLSIIYITYAMLQLRYLQTLNSISAENNSTIVFPVPIDIMSEIVEKKVSSIYKASVQFCKWSS